MKSFSGACVCAVACLVFALAAGGCSTARVYDGKWTLVFEDTELAYTGTMAWTEPWTGIINAKFATNLVGKLTLMGEEGRKREERLIERGRTIGTKEWNRDGMLLRQSGIEDMDGKKCWRYQHFWPNGNRQVELFAMDGTNRIYYVGIGKSWYSNGKLKTQYSFKDGEVSGPMKSWDRDGNLVADGEIRNRDPWEGTFARWSQSDANPSLIMTYRQGSNVTDKAAQAP